MKRAKLKKLSETIEELMAAREISAKELAKKSNISYSTLIPIINGSRDCGVLKLAALADALNCTPDMLLEGMYSKEKSKEKSKVPDGSQTKYLAVFISVISATYCMFYDVETQETTTAVLQFPMRCGQGVEEFLDHITSSLQKLSKEIDNKEVAVLVSVQQYGRAVNRAKIQKKGNHYFSKFIIESDAATNYRGLFGWKNGICITINDGDIIAYSTDKGENIINLQGYGFPISDVAGNFWIGCEAIKHVINVKEGIEESSLLSDKILATFNDDINYLSEYTMTNMGKSYAKASSIVKELMHQKQKSYEIVAKSAGLLMQRIKLVDEQTKTQLPICVSGDLAYIYESFLPEDRLMKFKNNHNTILLNYGIDMLKNTINSKTVRS